MSVTLWRIMVPILLYLRTGSSQIRRHRLGCELSVHPCGSLSLARRDVKHTVKTRPYGHTAGNVSV